MKGLIGARLQTFPDDYIFVGSKMLQYKMIGNAVPPLFAKNACIGSLRNYKKIWSLMWTCFNPRKANFTDNEQK